MKFLRIIPFVFIFIGMQPYMNLSLAGSKNANEYKVLSSANKKLSISDVQEFLTTGDNLVKNDDFETAKQNYDKARNLAKQLAGFYRDLNSSFKGLDARVPMEMETKGNTQLHEQIFV